MHLAADIGGTKGNFAVVDRAKEGRIIEEFTLVSREYGDFTAMVAFDATGDGTLLSKCPPAANWAPNAKALFIRDGKLVLATSNLESDSVTVLLGGTVHLQLSLPFSVLHSLLILP